MVPADDRQETRGSALHLYTGSVMTMAHAAAGAAIAQGTRSRLRAAVAAVAAHAVLARSVFGRWVYATGGGYSASRAAGVPVRRTIIAAFALSGLFSAMGGVLLASVIESARQADGSGYEFNAVAAVAIGGNSLLGGSGTIPRTIVGVLILGIINNLMILIGVPGESQNLVKGVIVVVAVLMDIRLRRQGSR